MAGSGLGWIALGWILLIRTAEHRVQSPESRVQNTKGGKPAHVCIRLMLYASPVDPGQQRRNYPEAMGGLCGKKGVGTALDGEPWRLGRFIDEVHLYAECGLCMYIHQGLRI